jgi:hypothetical protein
MELRLGVVVVHRAGIRRSVCMAARSGAAIGGQKISVPQVLGDGRLTDTLPLVRGPVEMTDVDFVVRCCQAGTRLGGGKRRPAADHSGQHRSA